VKRKQRLTEMAGRDDLSSSVGELTIVCVPAIGPSHKAASEFD